MKTANLSKKYILLLMLISAFTSMRAKLTPTQGLKNLKQANQKFVNNTAFEKQRKELVKGQNPSHIILSCSDSRATPEYIFDQPLGAMFTVRTAGQVIDEVAVDTIEFAVKSWDVVNLVVMGHENCGAVDGALKRLRENNGKVKVPKGYKRSPIDAVLVPIERAIVAAKVDIHASDALQKATIANVNYIVEQLQKRSSVIRNAIKNKKINLVGSVYSLDTGEVAFSTDVSLKSQKTS